MYVKLLEWELEGVIGMLDKTHPGTTLSTINPMWRGMEHGTSSISGKPAISSLKYGTDSNVLEFSVEDIRSNKLQFRGI